MSPYATFAFLVLSLALCTALAGMVTAWTWAISRTWLGQAVLPAARARPVPWGAGSVLGAFLVWLAINIAVPLAYLKWSGALHDHRKPSLTEQMALQSVINALVLCVIPWTLRCASGATLSALGLERRELLRQAAVGTTGFLLMAPLVYLANMLALLVWNQQKHPLEKMVTAEPTLAVACLAFVSAVLLGPAAEELLFRGILQGWLAQFVRRRERFGDGTADSTAPDPDAPAAATSEMVPIVTVSALFAAVHFEQWPAPIAIFFLSVGLGIVYQRTGSVFASFLMHALFNSFSTMILFQTLLLGLPSDPKAAPTASCFHAERSCAAAHPMPLVCNAQPCR